MNFEEKTISKSNIYTGKIISLELHDVKLSNDKITKREIIHHQGGVAVIPVASNNEIYFVKQFRKPYEDEILEIPAGKLEVNESPELCGSRELKEETGLSTSKLTFLTQMYPSPGYTDEIVHIYMAEELEEGLAQKDEDEFLNVCKYSLDQAMQMIKDGIIKDGKTIIAILMVSLLKGSK